MSCAMTSYVSKSDSCSQYFPAPLGSTEAQVEQARASTWIHQLEEKFPRFNARTSSITEKYLICIFLSPNAHVCLSSVTAEAVTGGWLAQKLLHVVPRDILGLPLNVPMYVPASHSKPKPPYSYGCGPFRSGHRSLPRNPRLIKPRLSSVAPTDST